LGHYPLQFVHAAFLKPAVDTLSGLGADLERLSARSGLSKLDIKNPESIAPLSRVSRFIEAAAVEGGGRILGELAKSYCREAIPGYGDSLMACPDLLSACQLAAQPESSLLSHNFVATTIAGDTAILTDGFTAPLSGETEWYRQFSILVGITAFRAACGSGWKPRQLDVACSDISALETAVDLSGVVVRTEQRQTRMYFDTRDLTRRMPEAASEIAFTSHVPTSLQKQLFAVFDSLLDGNLPTIALTSDLLELSPRTLQRRLAREGDTFFDVIDRWRMSRAISMLHDPRLRISRIAARLGYSNSSHFSRAFRRWTGTTAHRYRENAVHQADDFYANVSPCQSVRGDTPKPAQDRLSGRSGSISQDTPNSYA